MHGCKPVKLLKVSDLGMHLTGPNGTYFESNYGCWAPLVIYKGTEATALSSKSIRLHLRHLMPLKNAEVLAFLSVEFRKTARSLFLNLTWPAISRANSPSAPNGTYFKSNYEHLAPLVIYKGTEATALSSKSIRLRLGHLNAVETC